MFSYKKKKSQAWGIDLMVAVAIFSLGIIIFFIYSLNNYNESEEKIEELFYDGKIIADSILSEGHPENWDRFNVIQIGLTTDNKLDDSKLDEFHNMMENGDYEKTRRLFNTKYDYYFFLEENMTLHGGAVSVDGLGKPGVDKNNITTENLIKITRFSVYDNKPVSVYFYVWG